MADSSSEPVVLSVEPASSAVNSALSESACLPIASNSFMPSAWMSLKTYNLDTPDSKVFTKIVWSTEFAKRLS